MALPWSVEDVTFLGARRKVATVKTGRFRADVAPLRGGKYSFDVFYRGPRGSVQLDDGRR